MSQYQEILQLIQEKATNPLNSSKFFTTHGTPDHFIGTAVPHLRNISKLYKTLDLTFLKDLIYNQYNETRLCGIFILILQYKNTKDFEEKKKLHNFYIQHINQINNWNLVDQSAPIMIGSHMYDEQCKHIEDLSFLQHLAKDNSIWKKRIAIVATQFFIRKNITLPTFTIATQLIHETNDMVQKGVGWMLRECGEKNILLLKLFLEQNAFHMPRTMLRYSIEKFPQEERRYFMDKKDLQQDK